MPGISIKLMIGMHAILLIRKIRKTQPKLKLNLFKEMVIIQRRKYGFLTLVRGGIGIGKVERKSLHMIIDYNKTHKGSQVLVGEAVLRAVELESKTKGPRIIADCDLLEYLGQSKRIFCSAKDIGDNYIELLWPAAGCFHFQNENLDYKFIEGIGQILTSAIKLWQAYATKPFAEHYWSFVLLVLRSAMKYIPANEDEYNQLKGIIKEHFVNSGLGGLCDFIFSALPETEVNWEEERKK